MLVGDVNCGANHDSAYYPLVYLSRYDILILVRTSFKKAGVGYPATGVS